MYVIDNQYIISSYITRILVTFVLYFGHSKKGRLGLFLVFEHLNITSILQKYNDFADDKEDNDNEDILT